MKVSNQVEYLTLERICAACKLVLTDEVRRRICPCILYAEWEKIEMEKYR